ncbi:MAG: recombination regulator RecX [Betaproteobacteria bacterium]|nr:recombination regulator RecX [Betaproteobacteria bacterium]
MSNLAKPENRELLSRALALLSRREMGRSEFVAKLVSREFDKSEVEATADWCEAQGFLSESRYVEGTARRLSAKYGTRRVAQTLRSKGVAEDAINAAIPELKANEFEQARALWLRKFDHPPLDAAERAKQVRFLQSRGFGFDLIKRVLAGADEA